MRTEEFREYLNNRIKTDDEPLKQSTIETHIRKIEIVEERLDTDLDTQELIGRQAIYASLKYTKESVNNRHPNQNFMLFKVGKVSPTGTPDGYRNSILNYRRFCGDTCL